MRGEQERSNYSVSCVFKSTHFLGADFVVDGGSLAGERRVVQGKGLTHGVFM